MEPIPSKSDPAQLAAVVQQQGGSVPADMAAAASFAEALRTLAMQTRFAVGAHQCAISYVPLGNFQAAIHTHAFSAKYTKYNSYDVMPTGAGIWSLVVHRRMPVRMTTPDLQSHPLWANFSNLLDARGLEHPPLRGWLAAPVLRSGGEVLGVIQLSDKWDDAEFTQEDLDELVHQTHVAFPTFELFYLHQQLHERTYELTTLNAALGQQIAERLKVEASLRESEARFRTLVEHAPEAIVVLDADTGIFIDGNDNACRLFGMPLSELVRHGPLELSPPVQPDGVSSIEKGRLKIEVALAGAATHFEWTHRNASGADIPCEVFLVRLPAVTRRLVRGSVVDISDRKRAERRELSRRAILEKLAQGQPLPAMLEGIVGFVEQESPDALCSILLLDPSRHVLLHGAAPRLPEFYNQAIHGLAIGPTVGSCGTAAFTGKRVIVEDIGTHAYWAPYRDLAGKAGLGSCWSEPILSSLGEVLGTFAIYHGQAQAPTEEELEFIANAAHLASIAIERTRTAEALRVSEERLRLAAEAAGFGTYDRDLLGGAQIWSANSRAIYGFGPDDPVNDETIRERIHPGDRERVLQEQQTSFEPAGRGEFATEYRIVHADGSTGWIQIIGKTLFDGAGEQRRARRAVGVAIDITGRKRAEEDRRKLEAQLQHTQKLESLGILAGGIAHDFNNLLTSILGYSDLALLQLSADSPARELIRGAVNGARRAAELTKQMLAYSGKGRFVVEPVNLSSLTEDMARLLEISISKKCVLRYNFMPNLPAVEADAAQVRQIIMNLIINASEAIGDRSGVIAISTGVTHCDRAYLSETYLDENLSEGLYVHLEVADSGSGMTEETKAKIFDPFFTTKFTGRGLGLSAVLGMVRGHRGAIKTYSELGKGTTFKVLFPATHQPVRPPELHNPAIDLWRGSGTVLIVDDEESVRGIARHMMESMGFAVLTAADGREAVQVFRQEAERVTLVLLDMTMPHLDGEETFREMRRIRPDVRAILMSGYNEQTATNRFAGKGLAAFIQKPFRYEDLVTIVRKVIEEGTGAAQS